MRRKLLYRTGVVNQLFLLPVPKTAVFGCYAPCVPKQERHTKPIHYGER
jgi:hypothetical protein